MFGLENKTLSTKFQFSGSKIKCVDENDEKNRGPLFVYSSRPLMEERDSVSPSDTHFLRQLSRAHILFLQVFMFSLQRAFIKRSLYSVIFDPL